MKLATGHLMMGLAALMMLSACASITSPQPPSLQLPKPASDLRALRKGDHVTLSWTVPSITSDRQNIRRMGTTRVCRGVRQPLPQCGAAVGEVSAAVGSASGTSANRKVTATLVDVLPSELHGDGATEITYAVESLNAAGRSAGLSNQVTVPAAATLPPPETIEAHATREGVLVSWASAPTGTPHGQGTYRLRVYRHLDGDKKEIKLAEFKYADDGPATFLDQSFEWEQTYFYRVAVVTVIAVPGKPEAAVEGDNSTEVQVFAHDIFPPAVPASLQAAFSGPGQRPFIDLIWAPVTDVDLEGYNVYRHEVGTAAAKLNDQPVKMPAYRDDKVAAGKKYFYSVSAVDVRGNESARSEESSESVP